MRRAAFAFLFVTAISGFLILTGGCNTHPLDGVGYDHWSGDDPGETGGSESSTTYVGSEGGTHGSETGEESETGEDASTTGDVGPECGNGIVEEGEVCDDGMDNGSYPASCSEECLPNPPE